MPRADAPTVPLEHAHALGSALALPSGTVGVRCTVAYESRVRVRLDVIDAAGHPLTTMHARCGVLTWRMIWMPAVREFCRRRGLSCDVREVQSGGPALSDSPSKE